MERDSTPADLLAHFDRPKTIETAATARVPGVERSEPANGGSRFRTFPAAIEPTSKPAQVPTRGIHWVFLWASCVAVLVFAASVLTEFAYLVAAEHKLNLAARAGAVEATLPRANDQSIRAVVEHRLVGYPKLARQLQLGISQNGSPAIRPFRSKDGDRIAVTLSAPRSAAVPAWLRTVMFWRNDSQMQVRAESKMPGRKLGPARTSAS